MPIVPTTFGPRPGRTFAIAVAGASVVLLALAIRQCNGLANDDAFITYRYARNLAAGLGFVFNPGERILGTTTPLYTLLLTPIAWLPELLPFVSNSLGCVGVALQAWGIARILQRLGAGRFFGAGAALFVLGGGIGSYWHIGLETNLLAALLIWVVVRLLDGRYWHVGILAGFATLCRPDAVCLLVLVVFEMAVHQRRPLRDLLVVLLGFALLLAPWLGFSKLYFGAWFPHSLEAKLHSVSPQEYLVSGALQLARAQLTWLESHSPTWLVLWQRLGVLEVALLAVAVGLLGFATVKAWQERQSLASILLLPVLLLAAYALIGSPPEHTWHLYPAVLFLYLGMVVGLLRLTRGLAFSRRLAPWLAWLGPASLAVAGFLYLSTFPETYRSDMYFGPRARALAEMGQLVAAKTPPSKLVSAMEIGIIGYICRNPIVDRSGIVTPGLYYHNPAIRTSLAKSLRLRPADYIVAEWLELREIASIGQYEILAAGRSRGYAPFFLLARRGLSPGSPDRHQPMSDPSSLGAPERP